MEGIEMDEPSFSIAESNDDFYNSIPSRFTNSTDKKHQHLCAIVGAMSQELKDHNLPSTLVAYFSAACSSLYRIASEPNPSKNVFVSLLTIVSIVITRVPLPVLKKRREFLSDLLVRLLCPSLDSEIVVISGLKCLSYLLINRDSFNFSDVSPLFNSKSLF